LGDPIGEAEPEEELDKEPDNPPTTAEEVKEVEGEPTFCADLAFVSINGSRASLRLGISGA
jgi:hypothetical protein